MQVLNLPCQTCRPERHLHSQLLHLEQLEAFAELLGFHFPFLSHWLHFGQLEWSEQQQDWGISELNPLEILLQLLWKLLQLLWKHPQRRGFSDPLSQSLLL